MKTWSRIAVAALIAWPFACLSNTSVTAQVADALTVVPDTLCDYCKDFTDPATATGAVRSAYRPGLGYAAEPESTAASVPPVEKKGDGLQVVECQSGARAK